MALALFDTASIQHHNICIINVSKIAGTYLRPMVMCSKKLRVEIQCNEQHIRELAQILHFCGSDSTCNKHSTYLRTDHLLYIEGHLRNHARLLSSRVISLFLSLFTTMLRYSTHSLLLYSITNYTLIYRHSFVIRYSTISYSNIACLPQC